MTNFFFDEERDPLGFERDVMMRKILGLYNRSARGQGGYLFNFLFVEACGISAPKLCQLAELHRDMLFETGDLREDENIGGVGIATVLRRVIAGLQRPGYIMLCLWFRALHFYWYRPEVQDLMIDQMQHNYDAMAEQYHSEKQIITAKDVKWNPYQEDNIFRLFGYCSPTELEVGYLSMTEPVPDRSGTNVINFPYIDLDA